MCVRRLCDTSVVETLPYGVNWLNCTLLMNAVWKSLKADGYVVQGACQDTWC